MNFEKLEVWQHSARLAAERYKATSQLRDYGSRDQLTRVGLSVPSNTVKGMTYSSLKEKCKFLEIARSWLAETRPQIYIGIEINYLPREDARVWLDDIK